MKLVKQLTLVTLQTAHHGSTSPRIASTQRNHASRPVSTDFCNKIGRLRTLREPSAASNKLISCGRMYGGRMRRRDFIVLLGSSLTLPAAHAQQVRVIGLFAFGSEAEQRDWTDAFVRRMAQLGWTE